TDIEVVLGRASSTLRLLRQGAPAPVAPATPVPAPRPSAPAVIVDDLLSMADEEVPRPAAPPPPPPAPKAAPRAAPRRPAPPPPRPEPPPAPRPAPAPGHASAFGESSTSGMEIEHMLMEGEVRMTVSDYANAAKVYARLVEAAPDVAAYRVKL